MNPETTLTQHGIENICRANGIIFKHSHRITDGFTNEVHLINDEIILKVCIRPTNIDRFRIETKMLEHKDTVAKPKLLSEDFSGRIIKQPYILMEYIPGRPLGSVWHTLGNLEREALIKDISYNLKIINQTPLGYLFEKQEKWGDKLTNDFVKSSRALLDKKIITATQVQDGGLILEKYKSLLNNHDSQIVFWDIHLDNFIVDKHNKLAAIIDLEATDQTALDYPLFIVQRLTQNPAKFLSLENEKYANEKDYEHLMGWYKLYYAEMFAFEKLDQRIMIYRLLDVIHLLKDWAREGSPLYDDLEYFISALK